jgi:c-di-GMP-binding flagellar brake protein YcgR
LGREHWIWSSDRDEVQVDREGAIFRWVTRSGKPFRHALFERVEQIKRRIALVWASSGTGVLSDGQNRRDSYRVQVSEQAQPAISIWTAADGEFRSLSCKLVELSLGGCSIRTQRQLPSDLLLRVDLTQNGRVYSVRASVAYTRQRVDDQRWMAGLTFVDTPSDFDSVLRQLWMTLQQEQLRRLRGD